MKGGRGGAPAIIPEFRDFRGIHFESFQRAPVSSHARVLPACHRPINIKTK